MIEESVSPRETLVVLAKKNGNLRFCMAHQNLNAVTRKDVFPMPRLDDLLTSCMGKDVFNILKVAISRLESTLGIRRKRCLSCTVNSLISQSPLDYVMPQ